MDTANTRTTENRPTEIYNSKNGLRYTLVGDYYLPNLTVKPNNDYTPGIWARKRFAYLKQYRSVIYTNLITTEKLTDHLRETDELAEEWTYRFPIEMAKRENVTEELKRRDPMQWVGLMNNIRSRVNELIEHDIICA